MTETTLKNAIDGAHAVVFHEYGFVPLFCVWSGGTTYNIYAQDPDGSIHEVYVFSVSDDEGRPLDREAAVDRMNEWSERSYEE